MCFCSSHISVIRIFRVCGALNKDFTFSSATRHDGVGVGGSRLIGYLSQLEPLQLRRVCDFAEPQPRAHLCCYSRARHSHGRLFVSTKVSLHEDHAPKTPTLVTRDPKAQPGIILPLSKHRRAARALSTLELSVRPETKPSCTSKTGLSIRAHLSSPPTPSQLHELWREAIFGVWRQREGARCAAGALFTVRAHHLLTGATRALLHAHIHPQF